MPHLTNTSWVFIDFTHHMNPLFSSLAERISERETAMVVDHPVSILRSLQIPPLRARYAWQNLSKRLGHFHPLHFPEKIPGFRRITQALNVHFMKKELDQLLPPRSLRIVLYGWPTHCRFAGKLGEALKIYYALDNKKVTLTGDPIPGELEAERILLSKVDLVLCVSQYLARQLRKLADSQKSPPIHVFPNHFNERFFVSHRDWPEPDGLQAIPRPRLLVAGHLSERIDWEGITEACQMRPSWNWVFLGPADPGIPGKIIRQLRAQGHYFPPIPVQQVPAWIQHCEACAAPYRLNSFTLASDPLKVIESLAMGTPVLATKTPSLERYGQAVEWVDEGDGESYAHALDRVQKQIGD